MGGRLLAPLLGALLAAGCLAAPAALTPALTPDGLAAACPDPCRAAIDAGPEGAFEPMVAVHPHDPARLVAVASEHVRGPDGVHRWNVAYASADGGATWAKSRIPGGPGEEPDHPLATTTDAGDAIVVYLDDGTVVHAGIALNLAGPTITAYTLYSYRSEDGGLTWKDPAVVAAGRGAFVMAPIPMLGGAPVLWSTNDKPWLAVAPDGRLVLGWVRIQVPPLDDPAAGYRNDALLSVSDDGGRTWSEPRVVARGAWGSVVPAFTDDGAWHLAMHTYTNPQELHVATSRDEGETWDVRLVDDEIWHTFPVLIAQGARLTMLYADRADDDEEVPVLVRSDDGGATWSEPLALDAPAPRQWQVATLALAGDGTFWMTQYRKDDADGPGRYLARPVRDDVVGAPVVLEDALEGKNGMRGHYMGLVGLPDGSAYAVWVGGPGADVLAYDLHGAKVATTLEGAP